MKYIKLYESFDIEEIKDCFLDIIDDGFEVDISNVDEYISTSSGFAGDSKTGKLPIAVPYIKEQYKFTNFDMCVYQYGSWSTTDVDLNEYLYRRGMSIGGDKLTISGRKLYPFIGGIKLHFYE